MSDFEERVQDLEDSFRKNGPRWKSYLLILSERKRQLHEKGWSISHDAGHTPGDWSQIIQHEVGCLAHVVLNCGKMAYRRALVKIAAVCVAALEFEVSKDDGWVRQELREVTNE